MKQKENNENNDRKGINFDWLIPNLSEAFIHRIVNSNNSIELITNVFELSSEAAETLVRKIKSYDRLNKAIENKNKVSKTELDYSKTLIDKPNIKIKESVKDKILFWLADIFSDQKNSK